MLPTRAICRALLSWDYQRGKSSMVNALVDEERNIRPRYGTTLMPLGRGQKFGFDFIMRMGQQGFARKGRVTEDWNTTP